MKIATESTEAFEKIGREDADLHIDRRGASVIIRFSRPEIRSPLSVSILDRLEEIADSLGRDVEGVIFTGEGDVFASGADLREISAVKPKDAAEFAERGQRLMTKIAALHQITLAAINGYCFGGALDLALVCDRRIGSPNAKFAHPGAGLGIITGWGGTQRLPRLIGTANSLEMFLTASPVDAARALGIGLIDEIDADPVAAALQFVASPRVV